MGSVETTLGKIMGAKAQILELKLENGGKKATIFIRAISQSEAPQAPNVQPAKPPTIIDYLRSGWQMNLAVAIDYTASNGQLNDPDCLHFMGPSN